jgi:hypothetical protein
MQGKRWCFTLNNHTYYADLEAFHNAIDRAYVIIGKEEKRVMYPAKLIKKNHGHYLQWDDDEGSISKLLPNGRVYSRHCAKSKPHNCQNCNPHVSFTQLN